MNNEYILSASVAKVKGLLGMDSQMTNSLQFIHILFIIPFILSVAACWNENLNGLVNGKPKMSDNDGLCDWLYELHWKYIRIYV